MCARDARRTVERRVGVSLRSWCSGRSTSIRQSRKIFRIFFYLITRRSERLQKCLAGGRRPPAAQLSLWLHWGHRTKRIDTHRTRTGHHDGNRRRTTPTQPPTSSRAVTRAVTHATYISSMRAVNSTIHLRNTAPPQGPQPCLQVSAHRTRPAAARLTGDLRTGGRTTHSPVHGCLRPPATGGNRRPGRGRTPPQHTSCAGTSNCRTECTSHSPASSSPAAGVEDIPPHDSCGGISSTPAAFHEDAGP